MRTVCSGLYVLRFEYLAALTRRIVETATGTGLPNPCLHQATGSIPILFYISIYLRETIAYLPAMFGLMLGAQVIRKLTQL